MKLLSMKLNDEDRAGILINDEVLDVTRFIEIEEANAGQIAADVYWGQAEPAKGAYRDALDIYLQGASWLRRILERAQSSEIFIKELRESNALVPLERTKLNPPVLAPGKILAVGLNYAAHAAEQNAKLPEFPLIFSKCVTALIGPDDKIMLPRISDMIDYEAELAVVIGREAKNIRAERAYEYVAGYTIMNDVTARDLQRRERQWTRAKGLDTFAPCGPWLVTADEIMDPHALNLELRVNGEARQRSNTSDLIFKIPQLIEFITEDLTLRAGDIISTGTPSGVGVYLEPPVFLKAGDSIEITIERIGSLKNETAGPQD
ncbi:MAG TPA: fumarylacetoacetate hydrolase family protein [Blastocatellia bacterium]|nr:fumarylacetoacetate hydrolase family protein [Blastocatellia bacterium]